MELATALIWTLRIVLPIILFCIYFKLQSPKDEVGYSGPTTHSYPRKKLLAHRKATLANGGGPVPEALASLALKDQTQAPELFVVPTRGLRGAGGSRREERPSRGSDRERRERRPDARKSDKMPATADEPAAMPAPESVEPSPSEDKMHLESLLNYVAFNRKEQQRTFLPDDADAPPPPPPKPRRPADSIAGPGGDGLDGSSLETPAISVAMAEKANLEAQMVLKGAINFKRADVARDLYDQLMCSQVEITELTFTLMIEACVLAKDLKSASDFLMKMETSGFCPDSDLLDKVMDLYSRHKHEKQTLSKAESTLLPDTELGPTPTSAVDATSFGTTMDPTPNLEMELVEGPRAKLSTSARIFVPSFGIPPPPPPPTVPDIPGEGEAEPQIEDPLPQRTKLTAAAKPFEPQFNVSFDPYMYTWTVSQNEEDGKSDRKGRGKDKGYGKGCGRLGKGRELDQKETAEGWIAKGKQQNDNPNTKARTARNDNASEKHAVADDSGDKDRIAGLRWKPKEASTAD